VDDFSHWLATLGPYSAPVNVVLVAGLWWLSKDRSRILDELAKAQADGMAVREKRVEDLVAHADEYREHSAVTQESLSKIMNILDRRGGGSA
jgi:hypothetical protein